MRLAQSAADGATRQAGLQRAHSLAARMAALLVLRSRGSATASCMPAAAWLRGSRPPEQDAAAKDTVPLAASVVLLRAQLRLLQAGGAQGSVMAAQQLAVQAAADARQLLPEPAQALTQLLLLECLPLEGEHGDATAAALWRTLFSVAQQPGDNGIASSATWVPTAPHVVNVCGEKAAGAALTSHGCWNFESLFHTGLPLPAGLQLEFLARLYVVRRAQTELAKGVARKEAVQAMAQARQLQPPTALLAWLKQQPPTAIVQGMIQRSWTQSCAMHQTACATIVPYSTPLRTAASLLVLHALQGL